MKNKILTFIILLYLSNPSDAMLRLDINHGVSQPIPLTIGSIQNDGADKLIADEIRQVLLADLNNCGLFNVLDQQTSLNDTASGNQDYNIWRKSGISLILSAKLRYNDGLPEIDCRILDPYTESIQNVKYTFHPHNKRYIAHKIADHIHEKLLGVPGYFSTRVAFIAESGDRRNRIKRLAIMDYDGANVKMLSPGDKLVLTPRLDYQGRKMMYMQYGEETPAVYLQDLYSGENKLLGYFRGMSFAPRFDYTGKYAIFSIAKDGTTHLYEMNLENHLINKLTHGTGIIDTSPTFSPDCKYIAFNSNRGGSKQIYIMNRDGTGIKRISFGAGVYSTPVWSPKGDYIAFTKVLEGSFYIGIMKPDGSGERLLTRSWLDEGPSWAPNGRAIMFTRQARKGATHIYAIDITGHKERKINTIMESSDPSWSLFANIVT